MSSTPCWQLVLAVLVGALALLGTNSIPPALSPEARANIRGSVVLITGSSSGIGHMIMDSQRLLDTGQMIFGILCIGVIGLVSDLLFKWLNQRMYPWAF